MRWTDISITSFLIVVLIVFIIQVGLPASTLAERIEANNLLYFEDHYDSYHIYVENVMYEIRVVDKDTLMIFKFNK